jgi:hypothetical protein
LLSLVLNYSWPHMSRPITLNCLDKPFLPLLILCFPYSPRFVSGGPAVAMLVAVSTPILVSLPSAPDVSFHSLFHCLPDAASLLYSVIDYSLMSYVVDDWSSL